jgi:hypothetical protein
MPRPGKDREVSNTRDRQHVASRLHSPLQSPASLGPLAGVRVVRKTAVSVVFCKCAGRANTALSRKAAYFHARLSVVRTCSTPNLRRSVLLIDRGLRTRLCMTLARALQKRGAVLVPVSTRLAPPDSASSHSSAPRRPPCLPSPPARTSTREHARTRPALCSTDACPQPRADPDLHPSRGVGAAPGHADRDRRVPERCPAHPLGVPAPTPATARRTCESAAGGGVRRAARRRAARARARYGAARAHGGRECRRAASTLVRGVHARRRRACHGTAHRTTRACHGSTHKAASAHRGAARGADRACHDAALRADRALESGRPPCGAARSGAAGRAGAAAGVPQDPPAAVRRERPVYGARPARAIAGCAVHTHGRLRAYAVQCAATPGLHSRLIAMSLRMYVS